MNNIRHPIHLKQGISRVQISKFLKNILLHQNALHGICFLRHYTFCTALWYTGSYMLELIEVERFGMQHITFYLFCRGTEKVRSLKISNFWPTPPLFVPVRFTCTHLPTYIHITELHPCLTKSSAIFMNFRMKNWGVKEKRIKFFVNST